MESINNEQKMQELKQNFDERSEASRVAISGLDIKDIRELKAFANPPKAVGDVFSVVLAISGNKQRDWGEAKK